MKDEFLKYMKDALEQNLFVKLTLGKYRGSEKDLQNTYAEPVKIGNEILLSFRTKFKTKDTFKNYSYDAAIVQADLMLGKDFLYGALYTTKNDTIIEFNKKREAKLYKKKPTFTSVSIKSHNKLKSRFISSKEKFLHLLGITNNSGEVRAAVYDKFRQLDKFIEIADSLYKESVLTKKDEINVTDFGSGKSYLTFALYHHFKENLGVKVNVTGVEQRGDLAELCNKIAKECKNENLKFVNNSILNYNCRDIDMVVALHACDTATDDAIACAIKAKAEIVILAPCCQKFVRKQITIPEHLKSIFNHGIIEEHISSFVTDGLRSLMLEAHGYKTKVFEFISHDHTAKNIMITALKTITDPTVQESKFNEIENIKMEFGLKDFYLDKLLKQENLPSH